jgi:hypothetical protein
VPLQSGRLFALEVRRLLPRSFDVVLVQLRNLSGVNSFQLTQLRFKLADSERVACVWLKNTGPGGGDTTRWRCAGANFSHFLFVLRLLLAQLGGVRNAQLTDLVGMR